MAFGMVFQRCRYREVRRAVSKPKVHDFVENLNKEVCFFLWVRWGLSVGTRAKNGKKCEFKTLY